MMSLFFLNLTLFVYAISYFLAKRTPPQRIFVSSKKTTYHKTVSDFESMIKNWVGSNPNRRLIQHTNNSFIISVDPSWITYGYFYHIDIHEDSNHLTVYISLQAKLVSSPIDESAFKRTVAEEFQLKDVG